MSKKTLFFSNIIGDISKDNNDVRFNNHMSNYLIKNINSNYSLIFIEAPGLGGEENYLPNIIKCFNKIGINYKNIIQVNENTLRSDIDKFISNNNKIVYFLMGGNPYTQLKIIKKLDMIDELKNYEGIVIGFCAGAINLSKYSLITSDEDFSKPDSYYGICRENICIEPHYNNSNNITRNNELKEFKRKYNTKIYCIPDESIIYYEDGEKTEKGKIYTI